MLGGSWVIPGINAGVPSILRMPGTQVDQQMAAFSLRAHAQGVSLPGGMFTNPIDTINKQWRKYVVSRCGSSDPLGLSMELVFAQNTITATVTTESCINIFRLKPVIEALNESLAGLGWLVFEIITNATADRYPIYRIDDMAQIASMLWYSDEFDDENLAKLLREQDEISPKVSVATLKKKYKFPWPSELVRAVDGHEWMLGILAYDQTRKLWVRKGTKPKSCSLQDARTFARQPGTSPALKAVAMDALKLRKELQRKDSKLIDAKGYEPELADEDDGEEADQARLVGASCALVWDKHLQLFEAIGHNEQMEMECGEATNVVYSFSANPTQEAQVSELIQSMQDFVSRHAAISRVLRHFPKVP